MATRSGLGVSTGIGKGEAQILTPFKSDYYKNKANLALKEKEKQEKEMASIGSMPVWSRDLGLFNKKRQEVIDFSTNNHRSLIEGDYDKKAKFNSMMAGLAQFAASSNAAQKGDIANKAIISKDDTKIYQGSKDEELAFSLDPGNFNVPILRQNFNSEEFLTDLNSSIAKLDPRFEGFNKQNIDGTNMLINKSSVDEQDIRALIDSKTASYSKLFGEDQVQSWIKNSGTDLFAQGEAFSKTGEKAIQERQGNVFNINTGKQNSVSSFVFNGDPSIASMNEVYGAEDKGKEGLMGYNLGDVTVFNEIALNKTHNFKGTIPPGAIPLDMSYAYNTFPTPGGAAVRNEGYAQSGKIFNINYAREGIQKDSKWTIMSSSIVEAYPDGYKTQDTDDKEYGAHDISGFPIGKKSKATDRFKGKKAEHRYYARMKDDIGGVILVPYNTVRESVNQKLTKEEKKNMRIFEEDTKAFLIEKGWSKAYKDFTGTKMPGSGNNSKTTSTPVLPLTQKQLDLASAFRAKHPEKSKDYTDEEIIQALKK